MTAAPRFEFQHVSKGFFGVPVLRDVCLRVAGGQVLGLVGENGAGKSTLMNILGGVLQPDEGTMALDGAPYAPLSPAAAAEAGVALVHQELNLFSNLTVADNLFLTDYPRWPTQRWGLLDRRTARRRAGELFRSLEFPIDPGRLVADLSPGERQLVEIAKGVQRQARVLVFDEPTTSLTEPDCARLFAIIRRLREQGAAIIFISHNLGHVLRECDQIAVLRDGVVQAAGPRAEFMLDQIISLMVGREIEQLFPERSVPPSPDVVLEARGLSQPGVVENISFQLHRGEILGLSGLMGAGRTELARILFGLEPHTRGEVLVAGRPLRRSTVRERIDQGLAFVTENRREEGLLLEASVEDNVALASLPAFAGRCLGRVDRARLHHEAVRTTGELAIQCRQVERQPIKTLSGGNQQKAVLGKWLLRRPGVLILDEPTRGVDIGAKHEIYRKISDLAAGGMAVLVISSELEELLGLCDRILVMARGEISACLRREEFDREQILRHALTEERLQ